MVSSIPCSPRDLEKGGDKYQHDRDLRRGELANQDTKRKESNSASSKDFRLILGLLLGLLFALSLFAFDRPTWTAQVNQPSPTLALKDARLAATENCPEQIHVSLAGPGRIRITWVEAASNALGPRAGGDLSTVFWGSSPSALRYKTQVRSITYATADGSYSSGLIFHAVIGAAPGSDAGLPLQPGKTYYYRVGAGPDFPNACMSDPLAVTVPRESVPTRLALVGDLGQTENSIVTVQRMIASKSDVVLHVGDLSYADCDQRRWDAWGRLVEPIASHVPYMTCHGNHENEDAAWCRAVGFPTGFPPFTAYESRYVMPYREGATLSPSPHFYSFDLGLIHVLMLGSYVAFEEGSEQYMWVAKDLAAVNRQRTPWVIAATHAPWYNSNAAHQGEYATEAMRLALEPLFYQFGVDMLFTGHVHAYERSFPVYNRTRNPCGTTHITIGDGGNREGLADQFLSQPVWSADREASYGFGTLDVLNGTHARWTWHRNQDAADAGADAVWIARGVGCAATRGLLLGGAGRSLRNAQQLEYAGPAGAYDDTYYDEEFANDFEYLYDDNFDWEVWMRDHGDDASADAGAGTGAGEEWTEEDDARWAEFEADGEPDYYYDDAYDYLYGDGGVAGDEGDWEDGVWSEEAAWSDEVEQLAECAGDEQTEAAAATSPGKEAQESGAASEPEPGETTAFDQQRPPLTGSHPPTRARQGGFLTWVFGGGGPFRGGGSTFNGRR